jgi:hypothetical protein
MSPQCSPLKFSRSGYLDELLRCQMPPDLIAVLRSCIISLIHSVIEPLATRELVLLAKEWVAEGLWIGEEHFDLKVCVPSNPQTHRYFFSLRPSGVEEEGWKSCSANILWESAPAH